MLEQLGSTCGCSTVVTRWILDTMVLKFKGVFQELGLGVHMRKKQLLRLGYARRYMHFSNGCVVYAPRTAALLRGYRAAFPNIFAALEAHAATLEPSAATCSAPRLGASMLLGAANAAATLGRVQKYFVSELSDLQSAPLAKPGQMLLSTHAIRAAEVAIAAGQPQQSESVVSLHEDQIQWARPGLLRPPPAPRLGSWVAGALPSGPQPFGALGIVVGVQPGPSGQMLEVLTLRPVTCGGSLGGRCSALRGVVIPADSVTLPLNAEPAVYASLPVECPASMQDLETLRVVREQVEFYLSDKNLLHDAYFGALLKKGFVPFDAILRCERIKEIGVDSSVLAWACSESAKLEVSAHGGVRPRRGLPADAAVAKPQRGLPVDAAVVAQQTPATTAADKKSSSVVSTGLGFTLIAVVLLIISLRRARKWPAWLRLFGR